MQIKEARVFNFGKLQNKKYSFAPGINVIYGKNEAGKTTLHAFLLGMLFGMEKGRGRQTEDSYSRYEPWHAPAFYSGALRFTVEGRPFYLERNFYHREKREIFRNEADGEELSVAYGDLEMLLGGIDKETFGNTYDVPQCGILEGKELAGILTEYLTDMAEGGTSGIHVSEAVRELDKKKKELNANLRKVQEHKKSVQKELEIERDLLEKDCLTLRESIEREEAELCRFMELQTRQTMQKTVQSATEEQQTETVQSSTAERQQEKLKEREEEQQFRQTGMDVIFLLLILAGMLFNMFAFFKHQYGVAEFTVIEGILGIALAGVCIYRHTRKLRSKRAAEAQAEKLEDAYRETRNETGDDADANEALEAGLQQAKRMLESRRERLLEKETRLYNLKEELEDISAVTGEERELSEEIRAVEMAADVIQTLAKEFREEMAEELNTEVSRWTSRLTAGKYDSVFVDEKGKLKVISEGSERMPEALSRGTLEQFYLAFRIAVGKIVCREEEMPLFLDETFCMYDDERLMQTLRTLAGMNQQIFLFTCQKREMELLAQARITYHRIDMD